MGMQKTEARDRRGERSPLFLPTGGIGDGLVECFAAVQGATTTVRGSQGERTTDKTTKQPLSIQQGVRSISVWWVGCFGNVANRPQSPIGPVAGTLPGPTPPLLRPGCWNCSSPC